MNQIINIVSDNNIIYKVNTGEKSLVLAPCKHEEKVIVNSPTKIDIISIPPSVPGIRGKSGSDGRDGRDGSDGRDGRDGQDGRPATIQVVNTITVNPDTPASVINEGTEQDARLVFHIPRGQTGSQGIPGQVADVQVSYDQGQTWQSAMVGNTAKIITGSGSGGGEMNVIEVVQRNGVSLPVSNKTVNVQVPTSTSQLVNDSGFTQSNQLSNVAFSGQYSDLLNKPTIPTKTSDLVNDSDFVEESDLSEVATTGDYNDLINKPVIPGPQIQSDWLQTDTSALDYIKNKPDLSLKEDKSNKVTSISSSSTNTQYPSAKAVYDAIQSGGGGSLRIITATSNSVEISSIAIGEEVLVLWGNRKGDFYITIPTGTEGWVQNLFSSYSSSQGWQLANMNSIFHDGGRRRVYSVSSGGTTRSASRIIRIS